MRVDSKKPKEPHREDIHSSGIPRLCQACEARHQGICGKLDEKQLVELSRHTVIKSFPAGSELLALDEEPDSFANILCGVVKLSKLLADGRQQIVGLQFAPDFLGRPFADVSRVSAEAATDVTICMFPRGVLGGMMEKSPPLSIMLHQQALDELDDAREWMLTLGRRTSEEKLASFLHTLAVHSDPYREVVDHEPVEVTIPLSRADIADFLGLTIETISRQFTKLRQSGVITKLDGRRIMISSLRELRDLGAL